MVAHSIPRLPHARIAVRESSQGPTAKEAKFYCDTCKEDTIVLIAWDATPLERMQTMKNALDAHRRICKAGVPEDMRVYTITYPR